MGKHWPITYRKKVEISGKATHLLVILSEFEGFIKNEIDHLFLDA